MGGKEEEDGEKTADDNRLTRSSFGNDPFDDEPMTGYTRYTGYTETHYPPETGYRPETEYEGHGDLQTAAVQRELAELEYLEDEDEDRGARSERGVSAYEGGLTAAMMDDGRTTAYLQRRRSGEYDEEYDEYPRGQDEEVSPRTITAPATSDMVPRTADPFKPPPPVPRGMSGFSDPFALSSRPATQMSRPTTGASYAYGSIYDGYAESRPGTTHELDPKTPATAALLPWLGKGKNKAGQADRRADTPPVPPLPNMPAGSSSGHSNVSGPRTLVERGRLQQEDVHVRRPPPAPVMAQTPHGNGGGGWQGPDIPAFR